MIATMIIAAMIQPSIYATPPSVEPLTGRRRPFHRLADGGADAPGRLEGRRFSVTVTAAGVPAIPPWGHHVRHPGAAQTHRLSFARTVPVIRGVRGIAGGPPTRHSRPASQPPPRPRSCPRRTLPSDLRIVSDSCSNSEMSEAKSERMLHGRMGSCCLPESCRVVSGPPAPVGSACRSRDKDGHRSTPNLLGQTSTPRQARTCCARCCSTKSPNYAQNTDHETNADLRKCQTTFRYAATGPWGDSRAPAGSSLHTEGFPGRATPFRAPDPEPQTHPSEDAPKRCGDYRDSLRAAAAAAIVLKPA
jgi:hypothetical protein